MTDFSGDDATEYCEKTFKTRMSLETFQKLALRTCRSQHWVNIEARDRSEVPSTIIASAIFSTIEDRDRFVIAMRFAEDQRTISGKSASGKQLATA